MAELLGAAHAQPTGTKFVKRAGRFDLAPIIHQTVGFWAMSGT